MRNPQPNADKTNRTLSDAIAKQKATNGNRNSQSLFATPKIGNNKTLKARPPIKFNVSIKLFTFSSPLIFFFLYFLTDYILDILDV